MRAHRHLVAELGIAGVQAAGDGRGAGGVRRAGKRDVAFAGQQPGGGIETDPAGAGKIDFGPRVQVGKVAGGSGGAFERFHVRHQLNKIAGDEAGGESEMAGDLHQQPGGIAAGAGAQRESFLTCLDAGLHADDITDLALDELIHGHQEVHRARGGAGHASEKGGKQGAGRLGFEKGTEIAGGRGIV